MIHLSHVSKFYKASTRPALDDVTIDVEKGEFAFVIGPSGSGKSTFLRLLIREDMPTSGTVEVDGQDLVHLRRSKVAAHRRRLGCVFQDFRLLTNKTVEQNVGFALEVIGRSRASIKQVVPEVLEMVGLEGKANRLPHELSGGEQQRVAIARAFANRPLLLLADEPTGNLDPDTSADIMLLLERINRTGTTVLMATHDNTIVDSMRRRVIELQLGKVVRDEARGVYGVGRGVRPAISRIDSRAGGTREEPMRAGFVVTEVLNGFRRNITMTIAMILTTAISLGLLGGGLIIARMTDQMRDIYGDKVEVTIYLTPDQSALDPDCRASPCQDINELLQANDRRREHRLREPGRCLRAVQGAVRRAARVAGDRHRRRRCRRPSTSSCTTRSTTGSSPNSSTASPGCSRSPTRARSWTDCSACSTAFGTRPSSSR